MSAEHWKTLKGAICGLGHTSAFVDAQEAVEHLEAEMGDLRRRADALIHQRDVAREVATSMEAEIRTLRAALCDCAATEDEQHHAMCAAVGVGRQ